MSSVSNPPPLYHTDHRHRPNCSLSKWPAEPDGSNIINPSRSVEFSVNGGVAVRGQVAGAFQPPRPAPQGIRIRCAAKGAGPGQACGAPDRGGSRFSKNTVVRSESNGSGRSALRLHIRLAPFTAPQGSVRQNPARLPEKRPPLTLRPSNPVLIKCKPVVKTQLHVTRGNLQSCIACFQIFRQGRKCQIGLCHSSNRRLGRSHALRNLRLRQFGMFTYRLHQPGNLIFTVELLGIFGITGHGLNSRIKRSCTRQCFSQGLVSVFP